MGHRRSCSLYRPGAKYPSGHHLRQERIGALHVVCLTPRQKERERIAQRVDKRVDFGAQSAVARPDRLVLPRFFSVGAMLVSPHDRGINLCEFVVGIDRKSLEQLFPNPAFGPAGIARMNPDRFIKLLRQISPRNAGPIMVEDRFHKKPIVLGRDLTARQNTRDPIPLIVP